MGRRFCLFEPLLRIEWSALPLPSSRRAKGGYRLGVSPDLRSSSYRGLQEEMAFLSFSKTTKGDA